MKIMKMTGCKFKRRLTAMVSVLVLWSARADAQNFFVVLNSSASATTPITISPPSGGSYSAAAPCAGTAWNNLGFPTAQTSPAYGNPKAGSTVANYTLYATPLALVNSSGSAGTVTLNAVVNYPNNANDGILSGSNTGGNPSTLMNQYWRIYNGGYSVAYTIAGLTPNTPYDFYFYGSTTTAGQGVVCTLAAGNQLGANAITAATAGSTTAAVFVGSTSTVTNQGTTWNLLHAQSDGGGNIVFTQSKVSGGADFMNGFQLARIPISTNAVTGGGSACTSVAVGLSGSESGVSYQLYYTNATTGTTPVAVGSAVSGTGSSFNFPNVTNSGIYTVVGTVTTGGGQAGMTGSASVTINPVTTISAALPASQAVLVGAPFSISVTAGGTTPGAYLWQVGSVTLTNGPNATGSGSTVSGATTATLTISNAQLGDAASTYTCTAVGGCSSPTSAAAAVTVSVGTSAPTITGLTNQTVLAGSNATLAPSVLGIPTPVLQWYYSSNGGTSSNAITGATNSSLTLTNVQYSQNNYKYYLLASNSVGVLTSNMTLSVTQIAPTITGLTNQSVAAGFNATFSATVGGAPAPALQWLVNGTPIAGATSSTLVVTNVHGSQSGYVYSLVATNTAGTLTSNATLTVTSQVFCMNFDVNRNYAYQNGTAAAPDTGTNWNMLPTSGISGSFTSNNVTDSSAHVTSCSITVAGSFTSWPDNTTGNPNPVNLMADYYFNGPYTITFSNLSQGTYALYDYAHGNALIQNSVVTVSAGNGGGSATTTANATYTSNFRDTTAGPGVAYVVLNGTVGSSGTFTFTNASYLNGLQFQLVSAAGVTALTNQTVIAGNSTTLVPTVIGTTPISYQWSSNGVAIANATNSTLPLNSVQYAQNGTVYSLVASNAAGADTNSMALTAIVTPSITGLNNQTVVPGTNVTIAPTVSGVPSLTLRWQFNNTNLTDGLDPRGSTIAGSTTSTLNITNVQIADTGTYSLIASNSAGLATISMTLTVSAGNVAPFMTGPTDQTVVQTSNATFTASVSGLPVPALQWRVNGVNIAGATGSSLTLTNVSYSQNGYVYSLVASNSAGMATNSANLYVLVPPSISQQPTNLSVTVNNPATFSVGASGVPAVKYQWNRNGAPIANATNASYTIASPQGADNGATFSVVVSNSVNSVTSSTATLTVLSTMAGTFLPTNGAVNISPDQQLRITFSGGTPKLAYSGKKLYVCDAADNSLFTTIDTSQFQTYTVDGATVSNAFVRVNQGSYFYYMPIAVYDNQAWITFTNHFSYGHTYYVTCDTGLFVDSTGASFPGITGTNTWSFSTKASGPATPTTSTGPTSITVGLDGAGDFATLQGASDWIPQNNTLHRTITIQPGTYHDNSCFLQGRSFVSVTGTTTNRNDVQLICPSASYAAPSTGNGATLIVGASDDDFRNITLDNKVYLTNTYANTLNNYSGAFAGRLLVLITTADRLTFDNVAIKGGQDTYYASGSGYFHNCEVWGSVDFIYGPAVLVFDQCSIVQIRNTSGVCTAPNTAYAQPYGMNFLNCTFPQALVANGYPYDVAANSTTFQRAWGQDGMTAIINCAVGSQISAAGWGTFGSGSETTCRVREYGTTLIGGGSVNVPQVRWNGGAYWANTFDPDYTNNPSLNPTNALLAVPTGTNNRVVVTINPSDYTVLAIFGNSYFTNLAGWTQATIPIILQSPTNQLLNAGATATFTVTASGLPAPTYQWLKNGTNLVGQTASTLTIANAQISDVGNYSVVVSNSAGTVTSTTVYLLLTGVGPAAPALSASAGVNQVVLTWSATPTATSYNLKRSTVSGGSYVTITNTSANGFLDAGLVNGTTYYYVVTALNSQGESVNSSEANATPACITPSVPSGVSAAAGNMQVILGWNAASFATSYNVKRATVSGGSYTTITNVVTVNYTDATAVNGTIYYYVVSAANSCAESGNSPELSATPTVAVAGAAIYQVNSGGSAVGSFAADAYYSGGTAFSTGTSINTNGVNNSAPMSVYQTERYGNSAYTFTNLTAGASYIVRLHFAELYWGTAGGRVFNVFINGSEVLTNFDIVATVGSNYKALVEQFTIPANGSGNIVIGYSNVVDNAKSSGIEILNAQSAPIIVSQPSDQSVSASSTATFTAAATGYPSPTYQWLKNGTNLVGQTNATLTITNAQPSDAAIYAVVASNTVGSVTSSNATLQINGSIAPVLTVQPTNQTVAVGGTAVFTVVASGMPAPTYQWLKNGVSLLNATNATLTLANVQVTDIGVYSLIAANGFGTATSVNAALTLTGGKVQLPAINLDNIIVVTNSPYNAAGDGATDNTTAIQNAINQAATGGLTNGLRGGTVEIPAGTNTYLCGPLNFSNNVNLQLDLGAVLQLLPYNSYPGAPTNTVSFITGSSLTNIAITGLGMIDGQGSPWWAAYKTNSRPVILYLPSCSKALFRDFTITNPPATHISIKGANAGNINFIGIKLFAPSSDDPVNPSHNTDGVDFAETNAVFQDCIISTGDDNIAIGSSGSVASDILVTNCFFGEGHGCSIGSFTSGGVSNLTVISCNFSNTGSGIRIKSARDRGGVVQNLNYYNLTMTNVDTAVSIISYYEFGLGTLTALTPQFVANFGFTDTNPVPYNPPIFQNITISNVTASLSAAGRVPLLLMGLPDYPINNILFKRMSLTANSVNNPQIYNATNVQFIDCSWTLPSADKIQFWNADVTFTNSSLATNLLVLDGLTTNGIGNTLEFDNASATIANTNAIAGGGLALAGSSLTVSNNLALTTATPLNYVVGTNPATLAVKGNLASGGIVNVAAGTGFTNGTYTLITYTGALGGNLPVLGTTPSGYVSTLNTNTAGQVKLIVTSTPGIPGNLTVFGTNLLIKVNWFAVSNAASYNVKRSTTNGGTYSIIANVAVTNYSDAAVNPGTVYYYVVSATNSAGESGNSIQAGAAPLPSLVSTNLNCLVGGNQLQLSWPADHRGWRLQMQTNAAGGGLGTNWFTVPGSTNIIQTNLAITPVNGSVFLRLAYP